MPKFRALVAYPTVFSRVRLHDGSTLAVAPTEVVVLPADPHHALLVPVVDDPPAEPVAQAKPKASKEI